MLLNDEETRRLSNGAASGIEFIEETKYYNKGNWDESERDKFTLPTRRRPESTRDRGR